MSEYTGEDSMGTGMRFYDIHCHAMNLSHPNLLLFIKRLIHFHGKGHFDDLCVVAHMARIALQNGERNSRIMNLLSVMERDTGEFLTLMERDLQKLCDEGRLHVNGSAIGQTVLTPLMIDFGRKDIDKNTYPGIYYNELSRKPIRDQVDDLFDGIRDYRERSGKERFLEIFPFLGLNTANYDLESSSESIGLKELLEMYFSGFTNTEGGRRRQKLSDLSGTFKETEENKSHSCAGIKVYPPLGFDPWPEAGLGWRKGEGKEEQVKRNREQEKVEYLYQFCVKRDIPITAHCNDSGFMAANVPPGKFTEPAQWRHVLDKYGQLKLNLAHFGRQDRCSARLKNCLSRRKAWQEDLVELMIKRENVYADFSYIGTSESWYDELRLLLDRYKNDATATTKLRSRILFGSDFMINLLATRSYKDYVGLFLRTDGLLKEEKIDFCSRNPEEFLFGKKRVKESVT